MTILVVSILSILLLPNHPIDYVSEEGTGNHISSHRDRSFTSHESFGLNHRGLKICFLNACHILPKFEELRILFCHENNVDIFCFCETFLHKNVSDTEISITGYNTVRRDRHSNTIGGGIIVYIKNNLSFKRRHDLEFDSIESIWIEVLVRNTKPFLICFVYRPPSEKSEWIDNFDFQVSAAAECSKDITLVGDFNYDISFCHHNKRWLDFIECQCLHQLVDKPTRVTKTSATMLDHLYVSNPELITEVQIPHVTISDHYPVCFTKCYKHKNHKELNSHTTITYRCFQHFNEQLFLCDLLESKINSVYSLHDPNEALDLWYNEFLRIFNMHVPIKTKRVKHRYRPEWYNEEIQLARRNREYFHNRNLWDEYKYWRNKTTQLIEQTKTDFFKNAVKTEKDTSYLWRHLNSLTNNKKDDALPHDIKTSEEETITERDNIVEVLNEHFINISHLVQKSTFDNKYFSRLETNIESKIPANHYFQSMPISDEDVAKYITKLDSSKATGIDGIGPKLLKICKYVITPSLTYIFNLSLLTGIFPDKLKEARVKPIHKGGERSTLGNYRPISILPTLSKILEKHISNQLYDFLKTYDLLHRSQSGFRENHSCQTAITFMIDRGRTQIDDRKMIGTLFLDFQKGFDLVDHNILLEKLKLYHLSTNALLWFDSYLSNRKQKVVCGGFASSWQTVKSGVPQGSIIGPLLFILYVNDLPLYTENSEVDMYADDGTLSFASNNVSVIEHNLSKDLKSVEVWCTHNNMTLNLNKTTSMLTGSRARLKQNDSLSLMTGNDIIKSVKAQKVLGIVIDNNLDWQEQFDKVCASISSRLGLLRRLDTYLDEDAKLLYFNAYILPIMDYGITIWGQCSHTQSDRANKLLKRAARIILHKPLLTPSQEMFNELNWLSFRSRVNYMTAVLVYKVIHNLSPGYLMDLLTRHSDMSPYNTRSASDLNLIVPKHSSEQFKRSFKYSAANIWNFLPSSIKESPSLNSCKLK